MTCKACKYDHPPAQDCKVAARIRANATEVYNSLVAATVKSIASVASFEHPNFYPNPIELGFDRLKYPKTSTQRSRERRARLKAA
jgi:hypothetical protein